VRPRRAYGLGGDKLDAPTYPTRQASPLFPAHVRRKKALTRSTRAALFHRDGGERNHRGGFPVSLIKEAEKPSNRQG
jgi:hypothetical protein